MCKYSTKTTSVFLPADGEASWSLLPSSVSSLSTGTVQLEKTYSHILRWQVWESQKGISVNTNHSYTSLQLPKPVSTGLTIKPASVLTNPVEDNLKTTSYMKQMQDTVWCKIKDSIVCKIVWKKGHYEIQKTYG